MSPLSLFGVTEAGKGMQYEDALRAQRMFGNLVGFTISFGAE
jgi:hypothetical protein